MSSGNNFKFTKSLRFRLTLIYSLILFLFTSSFVLGINLYLNDYLREEPPRLLNSRRGRPQAPNPFFDFTQEQMEDIRDIRLEDLRRIQQLSVISLLPISLLSFALGYYISGRFLYPLKILQKKIGKLEDKDLGSQVEISSQDEIGELADSFNEMSTRLKKSFDIQSQFVQDAFHELRTPLAIIQTNLDTALDDKGAKKEEMKKSIKQALIGIKRLNKLTNNLLDLTLPYKNKKDSVDMMGLLAEQYDSLKDYAKKSGVELKLNKYTGEIIKKLDRISFGRAIFNLIENAIKYSSAVSVPKVEITLEKTNDKAKITIKDNGRGIPKEDQEKVFERFFRVDKSRSRESGGFGLGLAISKNIVESHNGKISFTSGENGTTFWVII